MSTPVIAIFDVGKTNKKVFLFDERYNIVLERTSSFEETKDEDGDPCEDLNLLTAWVKDTLKELTRLEEFDIRAINFSAYGASFVHLDAEGKPLTPLYNYLKPYPEHLRKQFYEEYGGELKIATETASPVLGNLNSGMQLYRLKYEKPEVFENIKWSLHLPQYLSYLVTGQTYADITSVGCHTGLWDFQKNTYHEWVVKEGVAEKFPEIFPSDSAVEIEIEGKKRFVGVGLHDSSAAFIPFITSFHDPFVLLSTGTWCISLNAFNSLPLTEDELHQDCLSYISFRRNSVKASRLFAGNEHEQQTRRIASHFNVAPNFYQKLEFDAKLAARFLSAAETGRDVSEGGNLVSSGFADRDLSVYASEEEAYYQLLSDLLKLQSKSTKLVSEGTPVKRIFVDGGFSKNSKYMNMLAAVFPELEVFAASVSQATSVGAALALHKYWNSQSVPANIIDLKFYSASEIAI